MLLASLLRLFLPCTACQMASNCTTSHFSFTGRDRIDTWFDLILANDSRQLFSKLATAPVSFHHRGCQIQNPLDRVLGAHAASVDVRDEVAIGVGVGRFRTVRHVGGQAFSGCQPRSFADQEDGNFGDQQVANLVENSYPAVTNHKYPDRDSSLEFLLPHTGAAIAGEFAWQPRLLTARRRSRLANRVPWCNRLITSARDSSFRRRPRSGRKRYSSLLAAREQTSNRFQFRHEVVAEIPEEIQLRAHGITGGRMRLAQLHLSIRSICRPTPPCQQARRGLCAHLFNDLGAGRSSGESCSASYLWLRESVVLLPPFRQSSPGTIPSPA